MKVLSILALCAVLFFAVTYAYPTEDEEQAIEQNGIEQAVENADEERALLQDIWREIQEQDNAEAQTLQNAKAQFIRFRRRCPFNRRLICIFVDENCGTFGACGLYS